MDDRDVIARLRAGLDELTVDVGDTPPLLPPSTRSTGGPERRRVRWLVTAGVAVAAVVAVAVVVVVRANDAHEVHTSSLVPPTSTSPPATTATTTPSSTTIAPTTTVALAASDLVGGTWVVVDVDGTPNPRLLPPWFALGSDGSVDGFDGCRRFTAGAGSWALDGGRVRAATAVSSESSFACEEDTSHAQPVRWRLGGGRANGVARRRPPPHRHRHADREAARTAVPARRDDVAWAVDRRLQHVRVPRRRRAAVLAADAVRRRLRVHRRHGAGRLRRVHQRRRSLLTAPIFRSAIPYRLPGSADLFLEGDAGVSRLEPAG